MSKLSFIEYLLMFLIGEIESRDYERWSLKGVTFLKVIEICITRELDTDIHRGSTELKALNSGGFIGKPTKKSIHTKKLM